MSVAPVCQYIDWDSEFFGVRIGRVLPRNMDARNVSQALAWAQEQRIDCLYFLCDAANVPCMTLVENAGFRLTDIRVTMEAKTQVGTVSQANAANVRRATPTDIGALRAIARVSHRDTRFYADPHFQRDKCDRLYEMWIEKSCGDWADAVLVVAPHDEPLGYVSCHLLSQTEAKIGLVAIAASTQSRGLGSVLLGHAMNWCSAQGRHTVSVVTQGRNVGAQRLYQRLGFLTQSLECWFHYWR